MARRRVGQRLAAAAGRPDHVFGKHGLHFFTETKCVTTHWFTEADQKQKQISIWEGTVNR